MRANPANPAQTLHHQFPGNVISAKRTVATKLAPLSPLPDQAASNLGANNFNRNGVIALNITTWTRPFVEQSYGPGPLAEGVVKSY